jgi:hypothetical protein
MDSFPFVSRELSLKQTTENEECSIAIGNA